MELLPVTQSSSSSSWYLPYFRFPYFGCFLYPCLCGDTSHAVCNRSRNARASNRYNNAPDHRTEHDTTTRDRFSVRSESAPSPHIYNVCNGHRHRACFVPRFRRSPVQGRLLRFRLSFQKCPDLFGGRLPSCDRSCDRRWTWRLLWSRILEFRIVRQIPFLKLWMIVIYS